MPECAEWRREWDWTARAPKNKQLICRDKIGRFIGALPRSLPQNNTTLALVVASLKAVSAALRRADLAHCLNGDAIRDSAKANFETLIG
jgi:hypothetical protein